MVDSPADLLRKARAARGFRSATAAAKRYGWKVPTYISHENGTRGIRGIPKEAAQKYAAAFGNVSEHALMGTATGDDKGQGIATNVIVVGEAAMGIWRDLGLAEQPGEKHRMLSVPGPAGRRAVRVVDDSVNLSILPGEFAVYVALNPVHPDVSDGALVLIDRRRGGLLERSIRRVEMRSDGKMRLSTHSSVAKLAEALSYPSPKSGDEITLVGRIIGKYVEFE